MSEQTQSTAMQTFSGVAQTSFGDREAARSDQIVPYKAKKGRTDRIAIIDPNFLLVARAHSHFVEGKDKKGLGYVLCKSTYERQGDLEVPKTIGLCCKMLQEARKRCVSAVIHYTTDPRTGEPVKPLDINLTGWVFGPEKFENLFTINDEFAERDEEGKILVNGLSKVDLIITCEDEEWQRIKIVATPRCVRTHPTFKEKYDDMIASWMLAMKPRLTKLVGKDVTDQEIIEKAGDGTATTGVQAAIVKAQSAPDDISSLFS